MATKRTKADKEQRQADQLEKKSERRPEQGTGKKKSTQGLQPGRLVDVESRPRNRRRKSPKLLADVLR